jgi:hypothetical protein
MAKLRTDIIKKLKATPEFRMRLALSMNLSEYAVMRNLKTNHNNSSLTKIDALNCIKELLGLDNIEQLLDK